MNLIANIKKSKVIHNGIWLFVLQIFNTLIPLLTLPYITRILGSSQYGLFSFSINLIGYFQVIVEYGFNLSGSRKVALTNNKNVISKIYSNIMATKLLLCIFTGISLGLVFVFFPVSSTQKGIMLALFLTVIGSSIQQTWIFQGLQKMKFITMTSVASRTLSLILIFLLVKEPRDVLLYCLLYSITFLFNGIIGLIFIKFNLKIKLVNIKFRDVLEELRDGWYIFSTSALTKIFTGLGITILGFVATNSDVGVYSAVQKIPLLILTLFYPISQAIYPYISKSFSISFETGIERVTLISKVVIPIAILIGGMLIIFSEEIITILYGIEYLSSSYLITPLIIWMIFSVINNFLGIQILVASGYQKEYSIAFNIGTLSIVACNLIFGINYKMIGVALAAMLSEAILTIALIYQINKIKKFQKKKHSSKILE